MISWQFTQKLGKVIITVNTVSLCGLFCRAKGDHSSKKTSAVSVLCVTLKCVWQFLYFPWFSTC